MASLAIGTAASLHGFGPDVVDARQLRHQDAVAALGLGNLRRPRTRAASCAQALTRSSDACPRPGHAGPRAWTPAARSRGSGARAQGWPPTPPGTPVFVEYFGWIFISGRKECTACATATADSAKPVAMSLSLPSNVVMSPHAQTCGQVRLHDLIDDDRALGDLQAPVLQRAERGLEAELQEDRVDLELDLVRLVLGVKQASRARSRRCRTTSRT